MLIDIVRFGHVIGIALGLGLAIYADGRFLRALSAPLKGADLKELGEIHAHVIVAMGLLWTTGLALLYARTGLVLSDFAPKLFFKVGIVTLLTINAVAIGRKVLPELCQHEGRSFLDMPLATRMKLAMIGAVSAGSWASLLALGVFQVFKRMDAGQIADVLKWFFAVPLAGALVLALLVPPVVAVRRYLSGASRFVEPEPVPAAVAAGSGRRDYIADAWAANSPARGGRWRR